jgi:ABC-type dipeptide/oligopeptide/nickel transport system ATPase subunit
MNAQINEPVRRTFEDKPAERGNTPLMFGFIGASGSGKTYSALRVATGMQRVTGGEIFVIDTEHGRAKHYSTYFKFRHVPFDAPFSPGDYMEAIRHCLSKGAKIIIIDSMSHEHSGQGGVLEWHEREVERLMKQWHCSEDKANIPAWAKPKAERRKLIELITHCDAHILACFRAKDKIKIGGGKVVQLGWMPDAGEEFVFELAAKSLLMPGAGGVPTWNSDQPGEKMMIKLPEYFRTIFSGKDGKPLDEEVGEQLARWSAGDAPTTAMPLDVVEKHLNDMIASKTADALKAAFSVADAAAKTARDSKARQQFVDVKDQMKARLEQPSAEGKL